MIRSLPLAAAMAGLLSSAALALPPTAPTDAARLAEFNAQSAAMDNHWQQAVTAAARAYNKSPSLENEFNLATSYENTGRSALAIPLYRDVAIHGDSVRVRALYDYRRQPTPEVPAFFIADEAAYRLKSLTGVTVSRYVR